MPNHDWDWLFAIGTIFASLDAFNIGANDVANSFATSVASRSLTLRQACMAAALCEFLGAVLVGARVSATIKSSIISLAAFQGNAGVQILGFTCALVASATWLMIATNCSWPVSTTYSIVSALAGVGVAVGGGDAVNWGWNGGKGLATIFAGFIIAPGIAAGFAATIYLLTKYIVLVRENPVRAGLFASPVFFFVTTAVLTMSIVYKGAPSLKLDKLSDAATAAAIVGTAAVATLLSILFWLPYVHAKVVKNDYTIRWYHFFFGPLLWFRDPPADAGEIGAQSAVPDYRVVKDGQQQDTTHAPTDIEKAHAPSDEGSQSKLPHENASHEEQQPDIEHPTPKVDRHPIEGAWILPRNLWIVARYKTLPFIVKLFTHGTSVDVHALQAREKESGEAGRMHAMHARAKQYDNKVEHLYSFVQVMTACTASFAHGSNDVANAIGPYSAIYAVWKTGKVVGKESDVPVWILVFGGAWIVIGLSTYGYNIMRVLGNRLTLQSPSRGYSMELGSAITVILASQYGIPVSTTMCITGATLGVGLCNGDLRAFNWRGLGWIVLGWVLTVPIAGVAAGCLMGILLNAPSF
ncbi:sodium:inorganic phosphate symporter [Serendipita vermifera]|nr:sodium:inorganic phosphate symporter [Serendipita vermifera]